jgi:hypothetical protein
METFNDEAQTDSPGPSKRARTSSQQGEEPQPQAPGKISSAKIFFTLIMACITSIAGLCALSSTDTYSVPKINEVSQGTMFPVKAAARRINHALSKGGRRLRKYLGEEDGSLPQILFLPPRTNSPPTHAPLPEISPPTSRSDEATQTEGVTLPRIQELDLPIFGPGDNAGLLVLAEASEQMWRRRSV